MGHNPFALVVVEKEKAAFSVRLDGQAGRIHVLRVPGVDRRNHRFHRGQRAAELFEEKVQQFTGVIRIVCLAELAKRRLKIIAELRVVVVAAGLPGFLERGMAPHGIRAPVVHVISHQVDPGGKLR